jgi:mannose-6-phosphate isomerase
LPDGAIGESWEVYGPLTVRDGPLAGRTLDSLVEEFGNDLLGSRGNPRESFPLLTKWLDCRDWLSVQVHPDDALAQELTGDARQRGKSEAWYVAQADPQARLIHGLKDSVAFHAEIDTLEGDAILKHLRYLSPESGSLLFTGAGTVHALGPGFLIYEIQQSSDLTYRLYDWGRDRPIHPEPSKRCMKEARSTPSVQDAGGLRCRYFEIEVVDRDGDLRLDGESFAIVAAVQGAWRLNGEFDPFNLAFGESALLPANLGQVKASGQGRLLNMKLGDGQP